MEIDVVGERGQSLAGFRSGPHLQRRTEMELADLDAVVLKALDRFVRTLNLLSMQVRMLLFVRDFLRKSARLTQVARRH